MKVDLSSCKIARNLLMSILDDEKILEDSKIDPKQVQFLTREDGTPYILGSGSFGSVRKAVCQGLEVAVKTSKVIARGGVGEITLRDLTGLNQKYFIKERIVLAKHKHPNIVKFFGWFLGKENDINIVLEFMETDLYSVITSLKKKEKTIDDETKIRIIQGIANGVSFLHSVGIINRDVKTKNVLLRLRDFRPKICDLGGARNIETINTSKVGTPWYIAPELSDDNEKCSVQTDIYSLGVVIWSILVEDHPSINKNQKNYSKKFSNKKLDFFMRLVNSYCGEKHERPNTIDMKIFHQFGVKDKMERKLGFTDTKSHFNHQSTSNSMGDLLLKSEKYIRENNLEKLLENTEKMVKIDDKYLSLKYYLEGKKLMSENKFSKAIEKFTLSTTQKNIEKMAYLDLALCYFACEKYEEAKKTLTDFDIICPKHELSFQCWGQIYSKNGQLVQAVNSYKDAIDKFLTMKNGEFLSRFSRLELAKIYFKTGSYEEAKKLVEKVLESGCDDYIGLNALKYMKEISKKMGR